MLEALIVGQRDPKVLAELAKGQMRAQARRPGAGVDRPLRRPPRGTGPDAPGPDRRPRRPTRPADQPYRGADRRHPRRPARPDQSGLSHALGGAAPPTRALTPKRRRSSPRPIAWMRSPASAARPPRSSSPRSGWTWASSPPRRSWCRGPGCPRRTIQSGPPAAPAPPARATLPQGRTRRSRRRGRQDQHLPLGERSRRLVKRRGKGKALVAVARSILVIVWHLLADPPHGSTTLARTSPTAPTPIARPATTSASCKRSGSPSL
jgi:transposase